MSVLSSQVLEVDSLSESLRGAVASDDTLKQMVFSLEWVKALAKLISTGTELRMLMEIPSTLILIHCNMVALIQMILVVISVTQK